MRAVAQEDPMGCGLACVAAIADVSYEDVLELVDEDKAEETGYYCPDLIDALDEFGLEYEYRRVESAEVSRGSIVFVEAEQYPHGHFLAKTETGWMNPWSNYPDEPQEAGFQDELPGRPTWVVEPKQ
jgi:hypothetical protein